MFWVLSTERKHLRWSVYKIVAAQFCSDNHSLLKIKPIPVFWSISTTAISSAFSFSRTFRRLAKKRVGSVRAPQNFPHPVGLIREINSKIKCKGVEDKKASWNILRRGIFQKEGAASRQLLYVEEAGANIPRRKALLRIQSGQKAFSEMEKGRICVENFIGELCFKALGLLWFTIHVLRIGQTLKKNTQLDTLDIWKCLRQLLQMEFFLPALLTSLSYPGKIASPV